MAEHISVSKISNYVEKEVTIKGWVYNRMDREGDNFLFDVKSRQR